MEVVARMLVSAPGENLAQRLLQMRAKSFFHNGGYTLLQNYWLFLLYTFLLYTFAFLCHEYHLSGYNGQSEAQISR